MLPKQDNWRANATLERLHPADTAVLLAAPLWECMVMQLVAILIKFFGCYLIAEILMDLAGCTLNRKRERSRFQY
jgi:hypothetical protein